MRLEWMGECAGFGRWMDIQILVDTRGGVSQGDYTMRGFSNDMNRPVGERFQ